MRVVRDEAEEMSELSIRKWEPREEAGLHSMCDRKLLKDSKQGNEVIRFKCLTDFPIIYKAGKEAGTPSTRLLRCPVKVVFFLNCVPPKIIC